MIEQERGGGKRRNIALEVLEEVKNEEEGREKDRKEIEEAKTDVMREIEA